MASDVRKASGQMDFSAGVDASKVPTIQSALVPNGLQINELAWGTNCSMRNGGVACRNGWKPLIDINQAIIAAKAQGATGTYQGAWLYDAGFNTPYFVLSIGGRIYKVDIVTLTVTDLSAQFNLTNPASPTRAYFCQAEEFLIIQAGDYDVQFKKQPNPPAPTTYSTTLSNFTVPYTGQQGTITLNTPYTGSIGDIVAMSIPVNSGFFFTVFGKSGSDITIGNGTFVGVGTGPTSITGTFPVVTSKTTPPPPPPGATLPLFWDGATLRRSKGITTTAPAQVNGVNEIPAATTMDYYMGRLWYAQGTTFSAGDIVGGPSGTPAYYLRDSLLEVTENPLCFGGDGFTLPSTTGNIRAITHTSDLNEPLGQGKLYIATLKAIYRLQVPVSRSDWIAADSNNQPLLTVTNGRGGIYGDRCVVRENSDLFYRGLVGFYSLSLSVQNFGQWGNSPISNNVDRIFPFEDRSLLPFASGVSFDNRLLETCLPLQTNYGVVFQGIAALDFNLISTLQQKLPPAWEGVLSGVNIFQLFQGSFGSVDRCFAVTLSDANTFQIWELTTTDRFDDEQGEIKRIQWTVETPAFTWGKETELKVLDGAEVWVDKIFGTVDFTFEYRPDADACWHPWFTDQYCTARSSCENLINPTCYPEQPYGENYKFPIVLPKPPSPDGQGMNRRPVNIGYQFQMRVTVKGWCRIRGIIMFSLPFDKQPYGGMNRNTSF